MLKNKKGITLIALVVTIVVLLILAGVTISLLLDENGIIAKSKDARTETRVSQIEDEVGMWKQHNFINKESNQAQENADTMLANLISRKLLTEDEIDREQELITIKKKDGTVIKEISYSSVTINISKTPATEKASAVLLKVDSVDGLTTIKNEKDAEVAANAITSLDEERKKEIIKRLEPIFINKRYGKTNFTTFEKTLKWHEAQEDITEATEEAFWSYVESNGGINDYVLRIVGVVCWDETAESINLYIITNPIDATSNEYIATANGTYTFKVQDIVTGKTYTKEVEVTNVDENAKYYVTNIIASETLDNMARVITRLATRQPIRIAELSPYWCVTLKDKETKNIQTFTVAYIIYNNQKIDISSIIRNNNNCSYIGGGHICNYLRTQLNDFNADEFYRSTQQFIIEKDGTEYRGYARVDCWKGMN